VLKSKEYKNDSSLIRLTSSIDRSLEIALKLNSKSKRDIEYFKSASLQTNSVLPALLDKP
jgi:hypothetical protein